MFFLTFSYKFPDPPPDPTGYRKHLKRYKEQQSKKEEFLDVLQPYIRQLTAEVTWKIYFLPFERNYIFIYIIEEIRNTCY